MSAADSWRIPLTVTSGALALILNILLAYIILVTKCSYIGKYKYLLFLYTISAAIYAVAQILIAGLGLSFVWDNWRISSLQNFFMNSEGYMFYDALHLLPTKLGDVAVDAFVSCFIQNVIILTLSFFYRYYVVCNPHALDRFLRNWLPITVFSLAIIGYEMVVLVNAMMPSTVCEEVLGEAFYSETGHQVNETAYIGAIIFVRGRLNWELLLGLGSFVAFITITGGIIVTLATRIGRALRESTVESETVARNQKKIFTLLIFQLSLPLVFNIVPLQIVVLSTYFRLPTELLVNSLGCILSFAQVIDPILIFWFIRPYRMALMGKFGEKTPVTSVQTAQSSRNATNSAL